MTGAGCPFLPEQIFRPERFAVSVRPLSISSLLTSIRESASLRRAILSGHEDAWLLSRVVRRSARSTFSRHDICPAIAIRTDLLLVALLPAKSGAFLHSLWGILHESPH